jgi:hypothetical protein
VNYNQGNAFLGWLLITTFVSFFLPWETQVLRFNQFIYLRTNNQ